jgi:hypothetical protein
VDVWQVGASVLHVPTGLFAYGLWQEEDNHGTKLGTPTLFLGNVVNSNAMNDNTVWFLKAGIKRTWTPLGATAIWGEYGQYNDQYRGLCSLGGRPGCFTTFQVGPSSSVNSFVFGNITGSQDTRWGVGVVQEIDSAAMHLFARWQHMDLDLDGQFINTGTGVVTHAPNFEAQNLFEVGGVIFF